jgi:3-dehydroquinate dehydratase-2
LDAASGEGPRVLVINGPNINMLGIREPDIYGGAGFSELLELCKQSAREEGFSDCQCFQSNHEGDLVDAIQDAYQVFDGIIINPGAYTHTSIAILDALKAVSIPAVEVHISDVNEREEFRKVSYVRLACFETISGMGIEGYRKAMADLATHLREQKVD